MEVITIDSDAFNKLIGKIEALEEKFREIIKMAKMPLGVRWLDNATMCRELGISIRTLANWRNEEGLPYTTIKGKTYYNSFDVTEFLMRNYVKMLKFRRA